MIEVSRIDSTKTEIVFCEEFNGEYVGWVPRETADRMGYTVMRVQRPS